MTDLRYLSPDVIPEGAFLPTYKVKILEITIDLK